MIMLSNVSLESTSWMYIYQVAEIENPRRVLESLNFILIDLQTEELIRKIRAHQGWTVEKKRMSVLWLRFLKEIGFDGNLDRELIEDDTIRMAAEICEIGIFTRAEREVYDAYWDPIRIERNLEEYEERDKKQLKIIEDKSKVIKDKHKVIVELKKQLTARSLE
jgi:hypothetical protein